MVNSVSIVDHMYILSLDNVWKIILSFVDYALVVFLIFIAFANILRLQVDTYGFKKVLPSLIMGVVLANLSWFICQIILEFSYALVNWEQSLLFTISGVPEGKGVIGVLYALTFDTVSKAAADATIGWGPVLFASAFGLTTAALGISVAVFPVIGLALVIIAAAFILLPWIMFVAVYFVLAVRFIVLDFLVVVSPLAFICLGFPMTQKIFQQWWSQFTRWTFMAPIAWFMFTLAAIMGTAIQNKLLGDVGSALMFGIVRYAGIIACLYYAIKLPFMLGGGIMNAWGGLGKKLAMHGLKAADKKIGDFTENRKHVFGGRWSPWGAYNGWKQGAQETWQAHETKSTTMGKAYREAGFSAPGQLMKNWREVRGLGGSLRNAASPQLQKRGNDEDIAAGSKLANQYIHRPEDGRTHTIQDAQDALKNGRIGEAQKHLTAAARLGANISDEMQELYLSKTGGRKNKTSNEFLHSLSRISNSSSNARAFEKGVGMSAKYDINGKDRSAVDRTNEAKGRFEAEGANKANGFSSVAAESALGMLRNSFTNGMPTKNDPQYEGAFKFLSENINRLEPGQRKEFSEFAGQRSEYQNKLGLNDLYDQFDKQSDPGKKALLERQLEIAINPKEKPDNRTRLIHYLQGLGKEAEGIMGQQDFSAMQTKLNDAMKELKINPASISPRVKVELKDLHFNQIDNDLMKNSGADKNILDALDQAQDPLKVDYTRDVDLAGHIRVNSQAVKIQDEMKKVLGQMNQDIVKYVNKNGGLGKVNLNDIKATLGGKLNVNEENMLAKLQKSHQKLDAIGSSIKKFGDDKIAVEQHIENLKSSAKSSAKPSP